MRPILALNRAIVCDCVGSALFDLLHVCYDLLKTELHQMISTGHNPSNLCFDESFDVSQDQAGMSHHKLHLSFDTRDFHLLIRYQGSILLTGISLNPRMDK